MFNHQYLSSTTQPKFFLFKMNNSFAEQTTGNTKWCVPVGTVNLLASGTLVSGSTFRGEYWAKSANADGNNYLTWAPGLMPRNYGTLEVVVQPSGAMNVKQMGVSAFDGTRWFEPAKTIGNGQQGYGINGVDAAGAGGLTLGFPNRLYFLSAYSPTKAVQKVYTLDSNNNLTLRDTLTRTAAGQTNPNFNTIDLPSELFSFKSFNNLDNHQGLSQYFKFSYTYTENPTYSTQDI